MLKKYFLYQRLVSLSSCDGCAVMTYGDHQAIGPLKKKLRETVNKLADNLDQETREVSRHWQCCAIKDWDSDLIWTFEPYLPSRILMVRIRSIVLKYYIDFCSTAYESNDTF